ncbi:MAG: hypothetical protein BWY31_01339 [Lentisphaerae bacterium ADurb.Bin242]|nr:MAG: hypothetical protein BWY31_01339 [Lentisphaerae bacterium ADurb.Bin242]
MNLREKILAEIVSGDGIGRRELAGALELDVRTVSRYTEELTKQGFISKRLASRPAGRPVYEFSPNSGPKYFAAVMPTHSGIHGLVMDEKSGICSEIRIAEFSTEAEIPYTAAKKIRIVFELLQKKSGVPIHAASLLFSRTERNLPFAREVSEHLCPQLTFPLFVDSPISAHAYWFGQSHREYRKLLFLHFGYALELALLEDDELYSENERLATEFIHLPAGNDILWHEVSLSNIHDKVAALSGNQFYDEKNIFQQLKEPGGAVMEILRQKEKIMLEAIRTMADRVRPDAVAVLALPGDLHTMSMPLISNSRQIELADGTVLPFHFEKRMGATWTEVLSLAAGTAEYRAWKRFFPPV